MGTNIGGTSLQNQYKDWLLGYNSNNGLDSTPRAVQDGIGNETPLQLSTAKVRIKPASADGDVFDIVDLSGTVLLTINTSTKTITAASGVKFSGDGSLLTGIVSTGTGGASEAANLELQADNDKDGVGDILLKLGATIIATIRNNGAVDGTTGEPVGGSFTLLSLDEDKLATLTGDEVAYVNVDGVASVQDADGVHGVVLANKWSEPNGGYKLDKTDDYASISDADTNDEFDFGNGEFAVEAYIKTGDDVTTSQYIVDKSNTTSPYEQIRSYILSGVLKIQIYDGTDVTYASYAVSANTKYHIVGLREISGTSEIMHIYVNGRLVDSTTHTSFSNTTNTAPLYISGKGGASIFGGEIYFVRIYNTDISDYVELLYNNGSPETAVIPYELRRASQTALTSGTLEVGKKYIIDTYVSGDDFTNVGAASNASGIEFVATGTTPTDWTNSSSLRRIGCVLEGKPENAGSNGWIMTLGGAPVVAKISGSPIARTGEKDGATVGTSTGATTKNMALSQKAGYAIKRILAVNNSGASQTVDITQDDGLTKIVNAYSLSSGEETMLPIVSGTEFQSTSADKDINISVSSTASNGVQFIIDYEKLY